MQKMWDRRSGGLDGPTLYTMWERRPRDFTNSEKGWTVAQMGTEELQVSRDGPISLRSVPTVPPFLAHLSDGPTFPVPPACRSHIL